MSHPTTPPGRVGSLTADRALVLAPHFDDEVLGCGGLLRELVTSGSEVRVLFLSDGRGGVEPVSDPVAFGARRRREAGEAALVLGLGPFRCLDLPDGHLRGHTRELARAIRWSLSDARPDLVLVPSPLEVSDDHRAAFAALHRVLSPLREDDELTGVVRDITVLLYEVNHPLHPDLLVDVSRHLESLRDAMACYASQQERHDYLKAALGLRQFRTLTLDPSVVAAEAYRRLTLADFTTQSLGQLVAALGGTLERGAGEGGPSVSVVVRTVDRPRRLREALDSLSATGYQPLEVVVVNDGGREVALDSEGYPFHLVRVSLDDNRGRAAAAQAGLEAATGDYVGFLDDDDRVSPEHFHTLVGAAQASGAAVIYSDAAFSRFVVAPGGDADSHGWKLAGRTLPYCRDFDPDWLLVDNYIPFNTLLIERELLARAGGFDPELECFEDWDLLIRLAELTRFHHLRRVTCEVRHFERGGDQSPVRHSDRAEFVAWKSRVIEKHLDKLTPERLARVVIAMRRESVEAGEEVTRLRAALARARRDGSTASRLEAAFATPAASGTESA